MSSSQIVSGADEGVGSLNSGLTKGLDLSYSSVDMGTGYEHLYDRTKCIIAERMRTAALLLFTASLLAAQPAGVEGVVTDAVTKQPLPGAHISMLAISMDSDGPTPGDSYGAIGKSDGRFSITGMTSGMYVLKAERTGYVTKDPEPLGASVMLKAGEVHTGLAIEMTQRAIIAGHVFDEYGDPVQ